MSETTTQILETFASLPPREQHELLVALLRRSGEWRESPLSDDHLVAIAEESFLTLDSEESDGHGTESR